MFITYNGYSGTILWTVLKGTSSNCEDFNRAKVFAFAVSCTNVIPLNIVSNNMGVLEIDIPDGLVPDVYSVKVVWWKNDIDNHILPLHWGKQHGWHVPDIHGGSRGICMAYADKLFAASDIESEATHRGKPIIKVKSHVATYGYDGLSSYELAVITGKTFLTQEEWVANVAEMNEKLASELADMKENIGKTLDEVKKQLKTRHIYLSMDEYEELVNSGKIDDNAMYGIVEGGLVKMIYFGRLPFVSSETNIVKTEPLTWSLTASISGTTIGNGGGNIYLFGSAQRTVKTYYKDGTMSSKVEYGTVEWKPDYGTVKSEDGEVWLEIDAYSGETANREINLTASVGTGSAKKSESFVIVQEKKVVKSITFADNDINTAKNIGTSGGEYKAYFTMKGVSGTPTASVVTGVDYLDSYSVGSDSNGMYLKYKVKPNTSVSSRVIYIKVSLDGAEKVLAISQKQMDIKAYYGSSAGVPTSVSTTSSVVLGDNGADVAIKTEKADMCKCHWVAIPKNSGYIVSSVKDVDNDTITSAWNNKEVGDYTLYYLLSTTTYISNTSNIKITKQ